MVLCNWSLVVRQDLDHFLALPLAVVRPAANGVHQHARDVGDAFGDLLSICYCVVFTAHL